MNTPSARASSLLGLLEREAGIGAGEPLAEAVIECGDQLLSEGMASKAVELLERARPHVEIEPVELELRIRAVLADALHDARRHDESLALVRETLAHYQAALQLSPQVLLRMRICEGRNLWHLNRTGESTELLLAVRRDLLGYPDSSLMAMCTLNLSSSALLSGDVRAARGYCWEAIVSARRAGDRRAEASALGNLGRIERHACRWAAAEEAQCDKVRLCDEIGAKLEGATGRHNLAIVNWKRGRLDLSQSQLSESVRAFSELGNPVWMWYSVLLRGMFLLHRGSYDQACLEFSSDSKWSSVRAQSRPSLLTTEFLGDVHLEQEQAEPALKLYDEVLPKAMALVPKGDIVAELRRRRAECFLLLGRSDEAYAEARTGLEHCRELGDRYEEAATYRILALSAAALGRPAEAKALFEQGFSYYEDIETPYEWGKLWMSYGDWLRGPSAGGFADARGALEAYVVAREHFERMGAAGRLAMVNARFAELSVALSAGDPPPSGPPPSSAAPLPRRPSRRRDAQRDQRAAWAREQFGMITRHRPLLDLLDKVDRLAKSKAPILILGESGTGKELVARGIHRLSGRSGAYLPINCSAIGRDMIESELFGHLAGSFTGAQRDKPGLFEVCDSGTAFLDEIGELNPDLQSKLLRFLETGETRRVGATKNLAVDVRIVSATNRERQAMERGSGFRSDLYYRLAHGVVELPPLRQRGDDVELLVECFLAQACERERRTVSLSEASMQRLVRFPWPGNVRQLRSVVEHAVIVANDGEEVGPAALMLEDEIEPSTFETEMELVEKRRIEEALAQHAGSKAHAARSLRLPRTTLIAKMKRHGLMP